MCEFQRNCTSVFTINLYLLSRQSDVKFVQSIVEIVIPYFVLNILT